MSTAESSLAPLIAAEECVRVHGLARSFGARQALANLSLTLRGGEVLGLIGANGGGKTTSLRILAGLLAPDAGGGSVLGHDLLRDGGAIRRSIGYMSQRFSLYPNLSVIENLRFRAEVFGVERPRDAVAAVIARFGLEPFVSTAPERLSGGWARLVQLAAALVHAPRLILLDEPTAGLDASARQAVWRQVARLAGENATLIMSTHDLADANRCSRIVFLAAGVVRGSGTPEEVARATRATVVIIRGASLLTLIERLETLPAVVAIYPAGDALRVLIVPGREAEIEGSTILADCSMDRAVPTLEEDRKSVV